MSAVNDSNHTYIRGFGKNLKAIRLSKKITQAQLAADLNVEISQISRIERGIINTSIGFVYSIAIVLEIDICELCSFKESM